MRRIRSVLSHAARFSGVGLFLIFAIQVQAGFIGYYAPNNFTLVNTNADGFVTTPADGSSITLTGGNNGSDLSGTTDLIITAPQDGIVTFRYLFSTLDIDPVLGLTDVGGFLVNDQFTPFSQLLSPDPVFTFGFVFAGQSFGFRVATDDNTGEPGILTISDFNAPAAPESPIPEPSLGAVVLLVIAAGAGWQRWRSRSSRQEAA